ncbi:MAG: DinB family protein [Anaerolineales bacterium]
MTENILEKLFEHNNWANDQIIQACYALSDEQLDAEPHSATRGSIRVTLTHLVPHSATRGSIRVTLTHLVSSQRGYLALLTLPVEERPRVRPAFAELQESARLSGEGLLALARDWSTKPPQAQLQTTNGYLVEPWVVMLQVINHATEHREQIKSMLTALGVTPPDMDGWSYGEVTNALIPTST